MGNKKINTPVREIARSAPWRIYNKERAMAEEGGKDENIPAALWVRQAIAEKHARQFADRKGKKK